MSELFVANPSEIAGLSMLVTDIGTDCGNTAKFVKDNGYPKDGLFTGPIIADLLQPFRTAAEIAHGRHNDIGIQTSATGTELNKTAWLYHDQEQRNYDALNFHTTDDKSPGSSLPYDSSTERRGATAAYTGAANYPKPNAISLDSPTVNQDDTAGLIAEVSPTLSAVNESIKSVTRMAGKEIDPLVLVLKPIQGNWNELRRIGESYKVAGNAMEACGKNLESGVGRVGPHWNGKAAISFENDWAHKQIAAMKWEGPVGRVTADLMGIMADKIREGIKSALTKLKDMLEDYVDVKSVKGIFKQIIKKVPALGQVVEVVDLGSKIYSIISKVRAIVDKIEEVKNKLKEYLSFISEPVEKVKDKIQEKIAPTLKNAASAKDLAAAVDVGSTLNRPQQGYDSGTGTAPWADA